MREHESGKNEFGRIMDKATGLALLAAGVALIAFSISASINSGVALSFAGLPGDKTAWLMFGGCIEAIAGTVMTIKSFDRE